MMGGLNTHMVNRRNTRKKRVTGYIRLFGTLFASSKNYANAEKGNIYHHLEEVKLSHRNH